MENNETITNAENVQSGTEDQGQEKTYTQAEVDQLLQAETDRRVTSALKKQELKNQEKVKEAQKLAAMNENEKLQYELEQREKAIAEKEKALALAENRNEAGKILQEKGLSLQLVNFVVAEDAETMNANISLLEKEFKKSVKAEVEKRLGGNAPQKTAAPEAITKESFRKMTLLEQQRLAKSDPEIYKSLIG